MVIYIMQMYALMVDFIIIIIAGATIITAFKRGFLRSIVLLVGYILAIIISLEFSQYLANYIYDRFIYEHIVDTINGAVSSVLAGMDMREIADVSLGALPVLIAGILTTNFGGVSGVAENLESVRASIETGAGRAITDAIVSNTVIPLLEVILCIILFCILSSIVVMIASIFKNFYTIPILGPINSLLGGIIGVVQAAIVLYLLAFISGIVIDMSGNQLDFFNNTVIQQTYIFKWFFGGKLI